MVLSTKEELLQLIEKLPESKLEKLLDIAKEENISEKFTSDNLLNDIDKVIDKHDGLLKRLA